MSGGNHIINLKIVRVPGGREELLPGGVVQGADVGVSDLQKNCFVDKSKKTFKKVIPVVKHAHA